MPEPKSVSVIIPTYNAQSTLAECLRSVIATGYPRIEVIVVDDISTDATAEIALDFAARHPEIVRYLKLPVKSGPARGRNAGAAIARGELLFFLDSDTSMEVLALSRFAQTIENADAVVGIYAAEPLNKGWVPRYKAYLNNYFFARNGVVRYEVFDASRAGIRADVFRALSGFNETLQWGMDFENEELGYRINQQYRMLLDPAIEVRHHFPEFAKLTRTYFTRVGQWMEIFLLRRKFESAGVTSAETGISTAALLAAFGFALIAPVVPFAGWAALVPLVVYLYGYAGFYVYVARRRIGYLPVAILLNSYFTGVLACGAAVGALRVVSGRSDMHRIIQDQHL